MQFPFQFVFTPTSTNTRCTSGGSFQASRNEHDMWNYPKVRKDITNIKAAIKGDYGAKKEN